MLSRMLAKLKANPLTEDAARLYRRDAAIGYQRLLMQYSIELRRRGCGLSTYHALALLTEWLLADKHGNGTFEAWLAATDEAHSACTGAHSALHGEVQP